MMIKVDKNGVPMDLIEYKVFIFYMGIVYRVIKRSEKIFQGYSYMIEENDENKNRYVLSDSDAFFSEKYLLIEKDKGYVKI